jgi:hypothetical protein
MAGAKRSTGWSFADDRRFIEIAASAKSVDEVAKQMNRSPMRVAMVAQRLGITLKRPDRRKAKQK